MSYLYAFLLGTSKYLLLQKYFSETQPVLDYKLPIYYGTYLLWTWICCIRW